MPSPNPADTGDNMIDTSGGHPDMDYAQHKRTYNAFLRGSQIAIVLLILLLAGMAVFLTGH